MKLTSTCLSPKSWGSPRLQQNGFYEYGISPSHTNPFKGFFSQGGPKLFKRLLYQSKYIVPPLLVLVAAMDYADSKHEYYNRKVFLLSEHNKDH